MDGVQTFFLGTPFFVPPAEYRWFSCQEKDLCKIYPHLQPIISHNPENPKILKILIQTVFPAHPSPNARCRGE